MRSLVIKPSQAEKTLEKILKEAFRNAPQSAIYKAFRKKDIKVNGKWVKPEYIARINDLVEVYVNDNILDGTNKENIISKRIVYEDENIMVVDKPQGLPVHPDKSQSTSTLIDLAGDYLKSPGKPGSQPYLCHRLDRNTGGLIIIAKDQESRDILLDKIKNREITKLYQCLVYGKPEPAEKTLKAYLIKDEKKSRVFIGNKKTPGASEIITKYKLLNYSDGLSLLEVELITGRTHQIRAHLAYSGHPVIGDGKYGTNAINRRYSYKVQALWACRISFDFKGDSGKLSYLKGRTVETKPGFKI